jgi:hypothetical protein
MSEKLRVPTWLARVMWFFLLPVILFHCTLWLVGKLVEGIGDAMQQGSDAIRDGVREWGRLLFSIRSTTSAPPPSKSAVSDV